MIKNMETLWKRFEEINQESLSCYAELERLEASFIPKKEEFKIPIADLKSKISRLRKEIDELERQIQSH